jgi:hypothetical protein
MNDIPPDDTEARLRWLEAQAEISYTRMYDAPFGASATAAYNDTKECLHDAIALAQRLGKPADADRLAHRLAHIKGVFRNQFSG